MPDNDLIQQLMGRIDELERRLQEQEDIHQDTCFWSINI
jgi:hypothetical protein